MKILDICFLILSVSLLCVLVTTAPAGESDGSSPPTGKTVTTTAIKNSATTAKNETSVAMPTNATTTNTTTNESTSLSHDTKETTPTSQAEKATDGNVPSSSTKHEEKPKPKSDRYLLYEVEKDIRNLSLDNVNYIIDMGPDVLAYSLLDKLSYREGDIENDPHLKVIEDNEDKLFAKLKARRKELTPVTKPPLPSTEPPPRVTTTHVVDVTKIKYDIMKKIKALSLAKIDNLLEDYDIDTLPVALGIELGYDDDRDVEHFQYLDDLGGERLREKLLAEQEKKSQQAPSPTPKAKPDDTAPSDDHTDSSQGQTGTGGNPDENPNGDGIEAPAGEGGDNGQTGTGGNPDENPNGDGIEAPAGEGGDKGQTGTGGNPDENPNGDGIEAPAGEGGDNGQTGTGGNPDENPNGDGIEAPAGEGGDKGQTGTGGNPDENPVGDGIEAPAGEGGDNGYLGSKDSDPDTGEGGQKEGKGPSQPGGKSDNTLEEEDEGTYMYNCVW